MAETPATGILKFKEHADGSVTYQVACDCTDPSHNIMIEVESDQDGFNDTALTFYVEASYNNYSNPFWRRFKDCVKIMLGRRVDYSADIMMNEQTTKNLISVLKKSVFKK